MGLEGLLGTDENKTEENKPVEVNFTKKNAVANENHLKLLEQLEVCFTESDLEILMRTINTIALDPPLLHTVADVLNINKNI